MAPPASWESDFDRSAYVEVVSVASARLAGLVSQTADRLVSRDPSEWPRLWTRGDVPEVDVPLDLFLRRGKAATAYFAVRFFGGKRVPPGAAPQAVVDDVWLQIFARSFHVLRQAAFKLAAVAAFKLAAVAAAVGVYRTFFAMSAEFMVFDIGLAMERSEPAGRRLARDVNFVDLAADLAVLMRPAIDAGGFYASSRRGLQGVVRGYSFYCYVLLGMVIGAPAVWPDHSKDLASKGLRSPGHHFVAFLSDYLDSLTPADRSDPDCRRLFSLLTDLQLLLCTDMKVKSCPCCTQKHDGANAGDRCDKCGMAAGPGVKLRRCKRCATAHYCSLECQKQAWAGGHKVVCVEARGAEVVGDAGVGPGSAA
ncbi:hypothetical protein DFJ74DRAFT_766062 [Hyaloraphidium curvatum]|nr:hypothetical protein DFJ74DRAFT_766062 [Hyaloraphidium curvatum]